MQPVRKTKIKISLISFTFLVLSWRFCSLHQESLVARDDPNISQRIRQSLLTQLQPERGWSLLRKREMKRKVENNAKRIDADVKRLKHFFFVGYYVG